MSMTQEEWLFVRARERNRATLADMANKTCPGIPWESVDIEDTYRHGKIRIISTVFTTALTFDVWNEDGATRFRATARLFGVRGRLVYESWDAETTAPIMEWESFVASELSPFVVGVLTECVGKMSEVRIAVNIATASPYFTSGVCARIGRGSKELRNVIEADTCATISRHFQGVTGERIHSENVGLLAAAISQLTPEDRETYRAVAVEDSPIFAMFPVTP